VKNIINTKQLTDDEHSDDHQQIISKKPAIPAKPTKLTTIYATPTIQQSQLIQKQQIDSTSNQPDVCKTTPNGGRENILELIHALEGNLKLQVSAITAQQWLQLSERLNVLQNSCVLYADKETMPPHSKFHFRELVTRVENQSRSLRAAGSKNIKDNEKLMIEVGQSLKQISNALNR
jgi:abelson tyrosine-protein kinase 1